MIGGFSNANGVTFATNIAGRIEASIVTNYLPLGNSTQFAGAVHTHDYAASDHSHSQYLTTAAQSDHTHSQYLNTSQSSLLQHTSATSAITANAMNTSERGNYFYTSNNTFANQTHTHGAVAFSGTNASATFTSASNGLSIQLSAAAAGGAGDGYNILAAGGSTANTTGTVVFSNSNGVSFGLNGATMTASHNGLTTARASNDAIGLNTALTGNGVSVTANSSGLSINVPAFLTTAAQSGHSHGVTLNLTNINGTTGGNSNGINLSLSAVVPAQTVQPVAYSAANGSANFSTLAFANSQGVSFSTGTQGLYATVKTDYLTTARASTDAIGLNSAITQNGVSMTANSSGLSLNFPAFLTTAAQSGHSHGNPTLALTNLSGTTASASNGLTLSLSAAAPGAAAEANWMTLGGNVLGNSSASGSTIQIIGGNNITLSGLNNSQIRIDGAGGGGAGYTALSIQNRQLGASTTLNSGGGQNSLWLSPLRVVAAVSASTILAEMISYSGTITSAATAQAGQTIRAGIWSQLTDPASTTRFDTWWTGAASLTFWNSGTSSVSYAYSQSGGQTTGSSAGSNLMTASVMGARHIIFPIGSTMPTGLYVVGVLNSSSSAGYSAAMSRMAAYFDNPLSVGQGTFGQATNNSIGYANGGTYRTTTGGLPDTLALTQIGCVANVMPFFKIGAI